MSDTADRVFRLWARGFYIFTAVVAIVMLSYAATGNNLAARVADDAVVLWSFYLGVGVYVFLPAFIWTMARDWVRLTLYFFIVIPVGALAYFKLA